MRPSGSRRGIWRSLRHKVPELTKEKPDLPVGLSPGWMTRFRQWRAQKVSDPAFRKQIARIPLIRSLAHRRGEDLFSLMTGFVHSQVLHACLETGVLHLLRDNPLKLDALSSQTGLPASRLEPLLRAAVSLSMIQRDSDEFYFLSDLGAVAAGDEGIATMIRHHQAFYDDLSDTISLVRERSPDSRLNKIWSYAGEDRDPISNEDAARYSAVMTSSQEMLIDEILSAHSFSQYTHLLDVGGGQGLFARAVAHRVPDLRVSLFDLPPVAEQAETKIAADGLSEQIQCHGGNFFSDSLPSGADCASLVRVLFDHGDANVLKILTACRHALARGGELVIAEPMAGNSRGERLSTAYFSLYLLAMGPGRCRTPDEIGALTADAGFSSWRLVRCASPMLASIIVATV